LRSADSNGRYVPRNAPTTLRTVSSAICSKLPQQQRPNRAYVLRRTSCAPLKRPPAPLLQLPTSSPALQDSVEVDSWEHQAGSSLYPSEPWQTPLNARCKHLMAATAAFARRSISPRRAGREHPDRADRQSACPQEESLNPNGLAEPRYVTRTSRCLKASRSPAGANGMEACAESEIGSSARKQANHHEAVHGHPAGAVLPDASKITRTSRSSCP